MKKPNEHHPFCNYGVGLVEDCKLCPRYFKEYPISPGQTSEELIKEHFPTVVILDK